MRWYRPHSFFTLLLTGFVFVSLPLFTALFSSIKILDGVVEQGAVAVYRSVDRVSSSRAVIDLLQDQERKARLYHVLGERSQLEAVNKAHKQISEALNHFHMINTNKELAALIDQLAALESHLVAALNHTSLSPEKAKEEREAILLGYRRVGDVASSMEKLSNSLMIDDVQALKRKVSRDKETLILQTGGFVGFSVLLIVVFVILISKPIKQIDRGIDRLGNGDFSTPVLVSGPRDLELLGQKLDWLRKRLRELDREKVKMVAHISHELKTPLASIKEGVGLLKDELVGEISDEQREVLSILDKNCSKLQKLIQNIVNFNMAQAKKAPEEADNIRLDFLIQEVANDHANVLKAREIHLDLQLQAAEVRGNRKQLRTIFDNLLSNAVKFTPDKGEIRILLTTRGKSVYFKIQDTGPGIDAGDRSKLFSPFFQGKKSGKAVVKGSGLGLAITREYVQSHGGSIRLLSTRKGASFAVTLPLTTRVET